MGQAKRRQGQRSLGSVVTFLRNRGRDLRDKVATVPCQGCTACCRDPDFRAVIRPDERAHFPEAVSDDQFGWVLPRRPDGSCIHLIDDRCSIYERRPAGCRSYDCRWLNLFGLIPNQGPVLEAVKKWQPFTLETPDDKRLFLFGRMIVSYLITILGGTPSPDEVRFFMERIESNPNTLRRWNKEVEKQYQRFEKLPPDERREFYRREQDLDCEEVVRFRNIGNLMESQQARAVIDAFRRNTFPDAHFRPTHQG
jgi:hypothetical protein